MAKISKILNVSGHQNRSGKLTIPLLISLAVCVIVQAANADTSIYVFDPNQSTIVRSGGIAGIQKTLSVTGQFRLTIDYNLSVASFENVDANLTDATGSVYGQNLDEIFNMTGLTGTVIDDTIIQFEGKTADVTESDVGLKLTLSNDSAHLTGKTTPPPNSADMFFYNLDAVATKKYAGGTGEPNDPYQIATAEDLMLLSETPEDYDKHFILTADIDLDPNLPGRKVFDKAVIAPDGSRAFIGVFDGNSHVISHLTIKGVDYLGLFGWLWSGAEIRDIGVVDANISGSGSFAGGLVGCNEYGRLTQCYSTGVVSGSRYAGGLVGMNERKGTISECYANVSIVGTEEEVGGLVGRNGNGRIVASYSKGTVSGRSMVGGLVGSNWSTIIDCASSSQVSGISGSANFVGGLVGLNHYGGLTQQCHSTGTVSGNIYVGGLVGFNDHAGMIVKCYASASVVGTGEEVGGLVGRNGYSSVVACHSEGSVSGQSKVGGLVGSNWDTVVDCSSSSQVSGSGSVSNISGGLVGENKGSVANSYSVGRVADGNRTGGLIGSNIGLAKVSQSFWDLQTSGQATSSQGTGKTTAEMQTAKMFLLFGWDFVGETANGTEDIWWILEGKDYPRLWWQLPADDFEDGEPEPLWFVYEVDPDLVQIREVNGRLETVASAQAQNVDAFYVSDGWRLDVTKEFAIRVDFHFSQQGGGDGRVTLGVIPSLDPSAMQWAELEAGCFDTGPFYLYEVRDRTWVQERVADRFSDGGTLYMSYNPDTDELYFSHSGYGKANAWQTVTGLLKGRWASEPVYVILGGGSDQVILDAGDAYLDNFVVDSGLLDFSATPDDTGTEEP